MTKTILIYIALYLLPILSLAQVDEFQKQFKQVTDRFLSESTIMVTQHYFFSLDSASAIPFDSSYNYIEKNDKIIHCEFSGVELFSDGTFLVRISNPGKYMVVSHADFADSSALGFFFNEGFSGFKNFEIINIGNGQSRWILTGEEYGVLSVEITLDTQKARILSLLAQLSANHPFISQINIRRAGKPHIVFIRIDYTYKNELSKALPKLSDYLNIDNELITPTEKFKDNQIKFIK